MPIRARPKAAMPPPISASDRMSAPVNGRSALPAFPEGPPPLPRPLPADPLPPEPLPPEPAAPLTPWPWSPFPPPFWQSGLAASGQSSPVSQFGLLASGQSPPPPPFGAFAEDSALSVVVFASGV